MWLVAVRLLLRALESARRSNLLSRADGTLTRSSLTVTDKRPSKYFTDKKHNCYKLISNPFICEIPVSWRKPRSTTTAVISSSASAARPSVTPPSGSSKKPSTAAGIAPKAYEKATLVAEVIQLLEHAKAVEPQGCWTQAGFAQMHPWVRLIVHSLLAAVLLNVWLHIYWCFRTGKPLGLRPAEHDGLTHTTRTTAARSSTGEEAREDSHQVFDWELLLPVAPTCVSLVAVLFLTYYIA